MFHYDLVIVLPYTESKIMPNRIYNTLKSIEFKTSVICITFFSSILLLISSCSSSNDVELATEEELFSYLQQNNHGLTLSNTNNYEEFIEIADHFSSKKIVLLGENHASQFNDLLDTKMMIYLHQEHQFNYYLAETGYGLGKFINAYINGEDESLLSSIMNSLRNTFSYTQENKARLERMRAYNLSLPENERITYIGIDVENQVGWGISAVSMIVRLRGQIPLEIAPTLSRVHAPSSRTYLNAIELSKDLLLEFELTELAPNYQEFLAEDIEEIKFILNNVLAKAELDQNPERFNELREPKITENYKVINSIYPNAKYYGKWGRSHIWPSSVEGNYTTFIERLLFDGSIRRGQIESIPIFYEDGFFASPSNNFESRPITFSKAPDLLFTNGFQALTAFDLNEAGSPFYRTKELVTGRQEFTANIVSLVFKLRDSPASNKAFD